MATSAMNKIKAGLFAGSAAFVLTWPGVAQAQDAASATPAQEEAADAAPAADAAAEDPDTPRTRRAETAARSVNLVDDPWR